MSSEDVNPVSTPLQAKGKKLVFSGRLGWRWRCRRNRAAATETQDWGQNQVSEAKAAAGIWT